MTNVGDLSNAFGIGNYMDRDSIPIRSNVTGLLWREQFSGRVYDGPWEGQMHTERGRDWFYMNIIPRTSLLGFNPNKPPEISERFYRGMYRWSEPLHAWVFVWTTIG